MAKYNIWYYFCNITYSYIHSIMAGSRHGQTWTAAQGLNKKRDSAYFMKKNFMTILLFQMCLTWTKIPCWKIPWYEKLSFRVIIVQITKLNLGTTHVLSCWQIS